MGLLATAASLAMAFGAPLVYLDQALTISRQRDSTGFSSDIPALLIIANLTRCFFWLGERFELALLLQSVLMIISQIYLQKLILKYSEGSLSNFRFTSSSDDRNNPNRRRNVTTVFDSQDEANHSKSGDKDRFNGRENLPTFDIVVQPPSPTSSNSKGNQNQNDRNQSSKKSSNDSKGRYSSVQTSHSDDTSNLSNSSNLNRNGREEEDEEEEDDEPTNLWSKTKKVGRTILRNFTTFSGQGMLQVQNGRPFNFWRWKEFSSYIVFILIFISIQTILYLLLGAFRTYISVLGYLSLGLESTLPIPQLISNQRRKSLSGFSVIVLLGWVGGDSFKLIYFIVRESPIQFITCSCFQLSIDLLICAQLYFFREKTRLEDEERKKVQEVLQSENGRNRNGNEDQDWVEPTTGNTRGQRNQPSQSKIKKGSNSNVGKLDESDPFVLAEEEEEGEEEEDDAWARNAWSKAGSSKSSTGVGEVEADDSEEEEEGGKGKAKGKGKGRS